MRFCSVADNLAYKGKISVWRNSNLLSISATSRISRSPVKNINMSPKLSADSSSIASRIG